MTKQKPNLDKPTWYLVDSREDSTASCYHCPFINLDEKNVNHCNRMCTTEAVKAGQESGLFFYIRDPQLYVKARLKGELR